MSTLTEQERHATLAFLFNKAPDEFGTVFQLSGEEAQTLRNWVYGTAIITDWEKAEMNLLMNAAIFCCYYQAWWWLVEQDTIYGNE